MRQHQIQKEDHHGKHVPLLVTPGTRPNKVPSKQPDNMSSDEAS
jgi:hypothetical protein